MAGDAESDAPRRRKIYDALQSVATLVDRPAAQVALRWLLERPGISAAAIGASSLRQLEENLGVIDLKLTSGSAAMPDAVSAPTTTPYPANLEALVRVLRDPH